MILWMQKHKKYLVVTIWISTIAFVGAGFVGWGTYSFNASNSWVAKVGNTKITQDDFQQEYSRLFAIYNQLTGGNLSQKDAQTMGIHTQTIDNLIRTTLMLNYARDLGLYVSDERVAIEITKENQFYENGHFSEKKYRNILEANNLRPSDYEESIRKFLLLQDLYSLFKVSVTDLEKESVVAGLYMKDDISIEVLEARNNILNISDNEIQEYWNNNQQRYMGEQHYNIIVDTFKKSDITPTDSQLLDYYERYKTNYIDTNKKPLKFENVKEKVVQDYRISETEKKALRRYVEYKKDSEHYEGEQLKATQKELNEKFGSELVDALFALKPKEALKPIQTSESFITLRLMSIDDAQPLDFETAKERVASDVLTQKRQEELRADSIKALQTFKGNAIGWVGRDEVSKLPMLPAQEAAEFLTQLFGRLQSKDYMITENKAILYEIHNQELFDIQNLSDNKQFLEESVTQLKEKLLENAFIEYLQSRYAVVRLDK